MKRQIDFRGKRTDNNEWVYGYYMNLAGTHKILAHNANSPSGATYYDVDPNTIGQSTDLLDKEGTEIYEGDILSFDNDDISCRETIIFEDGCFQTQDGCFKTALCQVDTLSRIVVGNIHDNPNLFEDNK